VLVASMEGLGLCRCVGPGDFLPSAWELAYVQQDPSLDLVSCEVSLGWSGLYKRLKHDHCKKNCIL